MILQVLKKFKAFKASSSSDDGTKKKGKKR